GKNVTSGAVLGTTENLNNLAEGAYTLVAIDNQSLNRGCENFATIDVRFNKTTFNLTVDKTDQNLCPPLENGSVMVTGINEILNGVTTPAPDLNLYGFQWLEGDGTPHSATQTFVPG